MPRHHLLLVYPHTTYRPPPDLSRPELRAAFEAGRARRAAGADDVESAMKEWYEHREGGRVVSQAYWAGLQRGPGHR